MKYLVLFLMTGVLCLKTHAEKGDLSYPSLYSDGVL